jgi:hypothetical protein
MMVTVFVAFELEWRVVAKKIENGETVKPMPSA